MHAPQPWPMWARYVARLKTDQDAGVGDTVKRIADRLGGQGYRWFTKKAGMPCHCTARQEEWNRKYPYA